jgi:hypothetical protein
VVTTQSISTMLSSQIFQHDHIAGFGVLLTECSFSMESLSRSVGFVSQFCRDFR